MELEDKIRELEEEVRKTKHNKATEHHIGSLRGKIAKLRDEQVFRSAKKTGSGYSIKKEGDATVMIVGFPSVGKSTLINALTNAESKVASYEFTTIRAIPGMMKYNEAMIQFVDLPGIISEASKGKGRGREVLSAARSADLILIVLEVGREELLKVILKELYDAGIRLDKEKPDVIIRKRITGGLKLELGKGMNAEVFASVLRSLGVVNAEVVIRKKISEDELIDVILGNRHYCASLIIVNKTDAKASSTNYLQISAETGKGLEELRDRVWGKLGLVRVYTKKPGMEVTSEPLIMKSPVTCEDVLNRFRLKARYSKVWGKSVKHEGQRVSFRHELADNDIVSFY